MFLSFYYSLQFIKGAIFGCYGPADSKQMSFKTQYVPSIDRAPRRTLYIYAVMV